MQDVEFSSTTSLVTETRSLNELDDLETTNNGSIKVILEAGTLTVTEGNDNDNVGVRANGTGDVLLRAYAQAVTSSPQTMVVPMVKPASSAAPGPHHAASGRRHHA